MNQLNLNESKFDSPLWQNVRVFTLQKIKHDYLSDMYFLKYSLHHGARV